MIEPPQPEWGEKLFLRALPLFPDGAAYLGSHELEDGRLSMHVRLPDAGDVTVFWGLGESYVEVQGTRFTAPSTREALRMAFGCTEGRSSVQDPPC